MRRLVTILLLVIALHIVYGIYISSWSPKFFSKDPQGTTLKSSLFFDYSGAINVKTNLSSGSGNYTKVIAAANLQKLDFVVFTDLNNFTPDLSLQGYSNNVISIIGGEYSYLDSRILNFDMHTTEHLKGPGRSQTIFADLLSQQNSNRPEGMLVLAHPLKPGFQLNGAIPEGLDAIEILNLKDVWQRAWLTSKLSFFWNIIVYPFNSKLTFLRMLTNYGDREIAYWDQANSKHKVVGFFGSSAEANARISSKKYIRFPSYETLFSIVRNHVLLRSELVGNAASDIDKITAALRSGQFYMSIDILDSPIGFSGYIKDPNNNISLFGAELPYTEGLDFVVSLPDRPLLKFEVHLYKDGDRILISNSLETVYRIPGPGAYRAVVRVKVPFPFPEKSRWLNWIVTNPIFIENPTP